MATQAQVNKFIAVLGSLAQAEAKKRSKWVLPSIVIAQAALETGWGTSSLMTKANAYFGIKWTEGYKAYSSKTKEVYDGVTKTEVAAFRAYNSLEESVADYFDLVTRLSCYKDMVNNPDYKSAIYGIDNNGDRNDMDGLACYATDPNYEEHVISIIKQYNLTQYDDVVVGKKKTAYYPKYTGSTISIVEALNDLNVTSTFEYRQKIAKANNIAGYKGTAAQNMKMVNLLKKGKLVKA